MRKIAMSIFVAVTLLSTAETAIAADPRDYAHTGTRELVALVNEASRLVSEKGDGAFHEFRAGDSKWRHGDIYIFVLDTDGNMVVHPNKALEGKNQLDLKDVNGKPIIKDILKTAIDLEKQAILFYLGLKDIVPRKLGKDRVDPIIGQEKEHVVTLITELRKLEARRTLRPGGQERNV